MLRLREEITNTNIQIHNLWFEPIGAQTHDLPHGFNCFENRIIYHSKTILLPNRRKETSVILLKDLERKRKK
jgi:hypothetical protein